MKLRRRTFYYHNYMDISSDCISAYAMHDCRSTSVADRKLEATCRGVVFVFFFFFLVLFFGFSFL